MKLTETEKKCIVLALDRGAKDGEVSAAGGRLAHLLRKRYRDGYALLTDLESLPDRPKVIVDRRAERRAIFGGVTLRFGKYRGYSLREIPADYLLWVLRNLSKLSPSMREAIRGYLDL
jgi:hypothetical protein